VADAAAEHDPGAHWEQVAQEWTDWARTPGHDLFWSYRTVFRAFLPPPGAATLEIGCGEGRVARELSDLGHHVTVTDIAPRLLAAAEAAHSADGYVLADAAQLPFDDASFDRVVAYNMLMDVADMPAVIAEAARVLSPGGTLTVSIVHPFTDRGRFTGPDVDAPFTVTGSYYGRAHFSSTDRRGGQVMHFAGWSHPLEEYTAALTAAGLAITELSEPRPERGPGPAGLTGQWTRLPVFLWLNARRLR